MPGKLCRAKTLRPNRRIEMERIWKETLAPAYLHSIFGIYQGIWMPQMDRCWISNDGLQVTSRLLMTKWGKVEHAAITIPGTLTWTGENEISWSLKMAIKNELFGENRLAIEVFPKSKNLVDIMDVYHLWVFPKEFNLPFGIHPTHDEQGKWIKRGCPKNPSSLVENTKEIIQRPLTTSPSRSNGSLY